MQFDAKQFIANIKGADDVNSILKHVEMLEQEINAGGDVGISFDDLLEISSAARGRCDELQAASDKELAKSTRRLHLLKQAATLDPSVVTVEFLREIDGHAAWVSDSYLSMRGICGGDRPKLALFLDRVSEVKEQARAEGICFVA